SRCEPWRISKRSSRSSTASPRSTRDRSGSGSKRPSLSGRNGLQLAAELLDLVAQLGRILEAELLGGHVHLLLERDDQLLELVRGHALDVALAAASARWHMGLLE